MQMRLFLAVWLGWMLWGCVSAPPDALSPTNTRTLAIINGASDSRHPAVGAITAGTGGAFCTGTLIAPKIVVTAAHCVDAFAQYGGPSGCRFRIDQHGTQTHHAIFQVASHPNYNPRSPGISDYDIAVLILANKVTNTTPIVANQDPLSTTWVGRNVLVMGYGLTKTQPQPAAAQDKQSADIPIYQVDGKQFIHYDQTTKKSACHGDSGGPALYQFGNEWRVIGVTSTAHNATTNPNGNPPTFCDGGTVDTRVDVHYTSFLLPYIQQHGSECQEGKVRACYTGAPATRDKGACKSGTQLCTGGKWSTCQGEVLPTTQEACDGKDDNCNGTIDEGCGCPHGTKEQCYSGPQGTDGVGVCGAGERECTNGQWGPCIGEIIPGPKEICGNEKDDNCNNQTDEGCTPTSVCKEGETRSCYSGPPGTENIGICKAGTQRCAAGQWGICLGDTKPQEEQCGDRTDNDCDNEIDEGCGTTGPFSPDQTIIARGFGCHSQPRHPTTPWPWLSLLLLFVLCRKRRPGHHRHAHRTNGN